MTASQSMLEFDTKQVEIALQNINFSVDEMMTIEGKGARVLIEGMRSRAAVDTGEMRDSIKQHVTEATEERIVDDVGPEAPHSVYQEYGTGIFAENGNGRKTPWVYRRKDGSYVTTRGNRPHPFVRPTAIEDEEKVVDALKKEFKRYLLTKWLK